jgi:hypothetical protein
MTVHTTRLRDPRDLELCVLLFHWGETFTAAQTRLAGSIIDDNRPPSTVQCSGVSVSETRAVTFSSSQGRCSWSWPPGTPAGGGEPFHCWTAPTHTKRARPQNECVHAPSPASACITGGEPSRNQDPWGLPCGRPGPGHGKKFWGLNLPRSESCQFLLPSLRRIGGFHAGGFSGLLRGASARLLAQASTGTGWVSKMRQLEAMQWWWRQRPSSCVSGRTTKQATA